MHKTQESEIYNKMKNSEKKIFNERDEKWLLRQVADNPKLSAPKLAEIAEKYLKKKCNPETIRRILRKHGLHGRVALKKPFINPKNRQIRLEFVQEHEKKDFEFWKTVIFADESKFNIFGSDGPSKVLEWKQEKKILYPTLYVNHTQLAALGPHEAQQAFGAP
ncbi:Transposable element Tc1 transposase [Eumeta japonica]|uniref:Transposable element Tc1 transposase n=1 Tax=Eumeta variegata TaxID=151549 RepID=A0A4C1TT11_EUMVA|nr:Transposable element Tc1 transposase [Eumeta japonica]